MINNLKKLIINISFENSKLFCQDELESFEIAWNKNKNKIIKITCNK